MVDHLFEDYKLKYPPQVIRICILLAFLFALRTVNSQTTNYHPFPDSNAIWNIESLQFCGVGFESWRHFYSIRISGDTVLNGLNYHKFDIPIEVIKSIGTCDKAGSWTKAGYYAGCIRQNESIRKVFFIPPSESREQLLYDFNLKVGDTLQGFLRNTHNLVETIESIDSVMVGVTYRRRWKLSSNYRVYLIEGIGSTFGLIQKSPGYSSDFNSYTVSCFQQDNKLL